MKSVKDFLIGATVGAVVTGVAVALTTPKTGEELREDILDFSTDAYNKGMEKAYELKERGEDFYHEQKDIINDQLNELRNHTLNDNQ